MPDGVAIKMEYIQKLFLDVQDYVRNEPEMEDIISFLDSELPEFRSVAYESASMELGLRDFSKAMELNEWKEFYFRCGQAHSFHLDIGLGWAFAKTKTFPDPDFEYTHPLMRWMVFDGIGYYQGLFRGRSTVKNHIVPEGIESQDISGFNQGIGRRLWYIALGEVKKVNELILAFPLSRQPDLWRGVGIACGYVGGNNEADLELLSDSSAGCKQHLSTGIALAAMSRSASKSVTHDIEMACRVICGMRTDQIAGLKINTTDTHYADVENSSLHWITQLESGFA